MTASPFAPDGDGVRLRVRVTPRAKRSGFAGIVPDADGKPAIAVKLAAPPVDGAANRALIAFLSAELGVPRSSLRIVSGEKARLKVVRVSGLLPEEVSRRLGTGLDP